ncbi:MAG: TadE/TadG family type IV pilus assembly protein [Geminicoccaceae bacterium]
MVFLIMTMCVHKALRLEFGHWVSSIRNPLSDQRGITSVQLALFAPVLFISVLTTFDLGRMMMAQNTLVHAADEAVRFAMVRSASSEQTASESDIVKLIRNRMTGLDVDRAVVDVSWVPENQPGAYVTVSVDYPYSLPAIGIGSINLRGSSGTIVTH